jgi:hypothetical protein
VAARDVLGVVLAEFQPREERRGQDAAGLVDQREFGLDQIVGVGRDLDGGVEQTAGDADERHRAQGGVGPRAVLERLVLRLGLGEQRGIQVA